MADDDGPNNLIHFPRVGYTEPADPPPETPVPAPGDVPFAAPADVSEGTPEPFALATRPSPLDTLTALADPGLGSPFTADTEPAAAPAVPGAMVPATFRPESAQPVAPRLGALSLAAILAVSVAAMRGIHTAIAARRASQEQREAVAKTASTASKDGPSGGGSKKQVQPSHEWGRKSLQRGPGGPSGRSGGSGPGRSGRGGSGSFSGSGGGRRNAPTTKSPNGSGGSGGGPGSGGGSGRSGSGGRGGGSGVNSPRRGSQGGGAGLKRNSRGPGSSGPGGSGGTGGGARGPGSGGGGGRKRGPGGAGAGSSGGGSSTNRKRGPGGSGAGGSGSGAKRGPGAPGSGTGKTGPGSKSPGKGLGTGTGTPGPKGTGKGTGTGPKSGTKKSPRGTTGPSGILRKKPGTTTSGTGPKAKSKGPGKTGPGTSGPAPTGKGGRKGRAKSGKRGGTGPAGPGHKAPGGKSRKGKKVTLTPGIAHGTFAATDKYGCRCRKCRRFNREYSRKVLGAMKSAARGRTTLGEAIQETAEKRLKRRRKRMSPPVMTKVKVKKPKKKTGPKTTTAKAGSTKPAGSTAPAGPAPKAPAKGGNWNTARARARKRARLRTRAATVTVPGPRPAPATPPGTSPKPTVPPPVTAPAAAVPGGATAAVPGAGAGTVPGSGDPRLSPFEALGMATAAPAPASPITVERADSTRTAPAKSGAGLPAGTSTKESSVSDAWLTKWGSGSVADMDAQHETEVTLDDTLDVLEELSEQSFKAHETCRKLSVKAREIRYELDELAADLRSTHNVIGRLTGAAMAKLAESMELLARKADEMAAKSLVAAELSESAENAMFNAYRPLQQATEDAGLAVPAARIHNEN